MFGKIAVTEVQGRERGVRRGSGGQRGTAHQIVPVEYERSESGSVAQHSRIILMEGYIRVIVRQIQNFYGWVNAQNGLQYVHIITIPG